MILLARLLLAIASTECCSRPWVPAVIQIIMDLAVVSSSGCRNRWDEELVVVAVVVVVVAVVIVVAITRTIIVIIQ